LTLLPAPRPRLVPAYLNSKRTQNETSTHAENHNQRLATTVFRQRDLIWEHRGESPSTRDVRRPSRKKHLKVTGTKLERWCKPIHKVKWLQQHVTHPTHVSNH
jgi:hypothetical protein